MLAAKLVNVDAIHLPRGLGYLTNGLRPSIHLSLLEAKVHDKLNVTWRLRDAGRPQAFNAGQISTVTFTRLADWEVGRRKDGLTGRMGMVVPNGCRREGI